MSEVSMHENDQEVDEFLAVAADLARKRDCLGYVRELLTDDSRASSFDRHVWRTQAELGWTSIALPEAFGGSGYPLSVAGRLLRICGQQLVPEPVLSTVGLATPVLLMLGCDSSARLLARVGTGECVVAVAESTAMWRTGWEPDVRAEAHDDVWKLFGSVRALDVPGADVVLLLAAVDGGCRWLAIDLGGVQRLGVVTLIDGRRCTTIELDGFEVSADSLLGSVLTADAAVSPILTVGAALTSAWMLGIAERAFELTVDYLKVRSQFGAVIGSYQALQHRAARLFCELEVARSVVLRALAALDSPAPDAALWASAAKARVGDFALRATSEAIQLHGGIGMTHEADVGLYFKAARVADMVAGDRAFHRTRAGQLLGIVTSGVL
jgi:alkylation response protein AidB-like acyl-CoA dehydrogenase